MPVRRVHRLRRGPEGVERRQEHAGRPAPAALPRLLRQWLRRVGAAGVERQAGGEERGAEPEPPGVRRHQQGQGEDRGRVQAEGLLRRHPRLRRQGQRQDRDRRVQLQLQGPRREAGRHRVEGKHGPRQPPSSQPAQRADARQVLHQQELDHGRPHRPLRRAHSGGVAVRHVPVPAGERPGQGHERHVPERPQAPVQLQRQQRGAPRRRQHLRVRHQLLRQRARQQDRARVRRRAQLAVHRRQGEAAQGSLHVYPQLRDGNGEDGGPPHQQPGQGPRLLLEGQDVKTEDSHTTLFHACRSILTIEFISSTSFLLSLPSLLLACNIPGVGIWGIHSISTNV